MVRVSGWLYLSVILVVLSGAAYAADDPPKLDPVVANAGPDFFAYESRGTAAYVVQLDGRASTGVVSAVWTQLAGAPVTIIPLNDPATLCKFDAPQWDGSEEMTIEEISLVFELSINGGASIDTVAVSVRIPGDTNGDDMVNAFDVAKLRQLHPSADFNGDGIVNAFDLAILRGNTSRYRLH